MEQSIVCIMSKTNDCWLHLKCNMILLLLRCEWWWYLLCVFYVFVIFLISCEKTSAEHTHSKRRKKGERNPLKIDILRNGINSDSRIQRIYFQSSKDNNVSDFSWQLTIESVDGLEYDWNRNSFFSFPQKTTKRKIRLSSGEKNSHTHIRISSRCVCVWMGEWVM